MEEKKFDAILEKMNHVCKEINEENDRNNPNNSVEYEVLQLSDLAKDKDIVRKIASFYNVNWTGNRDFMHIPDVVQVASNARKYPIIIAREKGSNKIIGISTIKYSENDENSQDPYFPESDAQFFSVTGILTRKGNTVKGIGKKIYEIAVRGVYDYEKEYPGTRLMCVVDCRNRQSLEALAFAVENVNNNSKVGAGNVLPANVMAYYELKTEKGEKLLEAPTLVLEVGLNPQSEAAKLEEEHINYEKQENEPLFETLVKSLRNQFKKYGLKEPVVGVDKDEGAKVLFYPLNGNCHIKNVKIHPGDTAKGNDRVPADRMTITGFIGPMPYIHRKQEMERE